MEAKFGWFCPVSEEPLIVLLTGIDQDKPIDETEISRCRACPENYEGYFTVVITNHGNGIGYASLTCSCGQKSSSVIRKT